MSDEQIVAQLADLTITPIDELAQANTGYYSSGNYVYLTAPQIATAYNMPYHSGAGINVGIISFGGTFLQSDLNSTFSSYKNRGLLPASVSAPTIRQVLLNGATGTSDSNADGENILDITCVATLVPQANITIYINTSSATAGNVRSTIARAVSDGCDVISMSWTFGESSGDFLSSQLQSANSNNIAFVNSSGDLGSDSGGGLAVNYPPSSPYMIAVGGTHLTINTGTNTRLTETTEQDDPTFGGTFGSGGGFSSLFSVPSWQSGLQYQTYNSSTRVTGALTSVTSRGIPDISGPMANAYAFYSGGTLSGVGGTSASTPVMAGLLARIKALTGKSLGSVAYNQIFYANPNAFYDITTGTNATAIAQGYASRVGWDPVTGMGAPNGYSLLSIIQGLRSNQGMIFPRQVNIRPSQGQTFPRSTIRFKH
jgi:kumamolisin